ncbi:probable cyclin-dependent serine/threonine-protein kinase DDB_G0292550 [Phymastichus coffea]|uniref:probable cyclin-dependent serine/threonine-protein kinase DDB_G0292550 n=1 Tax=Phymastichus coffea TaxID=108790 RepID=UPI00273C7A75|nr:probable cyclin-dependent serine/threonine-protein kinase DDB_G0292550 [Phymastichus coffea]
MQIFVYLILIRNSKHSNMHKSHSRFRFIFCTLFIVILFFGNEFVYGRSHHPVKRRHVTNKTNWNYYNLSNYSNPQINNNSNYQSGSGSRLYPILDFTNPNQIDPGFSPHYHKNIRYNGTYIPNIKWGNGNVNPNNSYPPANRYPNRNYSSFSVHNPYDNQLPTDLVSQSNLPIPRTTCGKTLCSYVPNYPTKEIGNAVDRARDVLRSGNANVLRNKGLSLQTFTSRRNVGSNASSSNRGTNTSSSCRTNTNSVYPHEGLSSDTNQIYYLINIPGLDQTITSIECDSGNRQICNQRNSAPMSGVQSCQQVYRKEVLLAVPFGKDYFDVNDFQLRTFYVASGCYCMWESRPY